VTKRSLRHFRRTLNIVLCPQQAAPLWRMPVYGKRETKASYWGRPACSSYLIATPALPRCCTCSACPFRAIRTLNHTPQAWKGTLSCNQKHSSCQMPSLRAYSTSTSSSNSSSSSHELVDWVTANGGSVTGVAPANLAGRDGASGWGLKATEVRHGRWGTRV
jgi:hypothetical protein